jgi:hypothetical protein
LPDEFTPGYPINFSLVQSNRVSGEELSKIEMNADDSATVNLQVVLSELEQKHGSKADSAAVQ